MYGSQPKMDRNSASQPKDSPSDNQQRNLPQINSMKNIREIDSVKTGGPVSRVGLGAIPPTSGTSTKETTGRLNSNTSANHKYAAISSQPHIQDKSRLDHYL